jgi:ankyrin repeat protein
VINYLLSQGVPVDSPMLDRTRPFDLAVFGSHVPAAALLAHTPSQQPDSYDGDWRTMRNDHMCTIAHWCGMGSQRACATWLMHHRVPFDVVQKEAQTPLHKAAAKKNYDTLALITRYLLSSIEQCSSVDEASVDVHAKVQTLLLELNDHDLNESPGESDRVTDASILSSCAACSTHASNPYALPVHAPTIPGQCAGDIIVHLHAHMNELDTSGLTALQVALAQGMPETHPAVRLLSVLN